MYAILKLKLIKGKCLIFTNNTDNCFRLKLFLERFYINAAVLNSELPLNSRFALPFFFFFFFPFFFFVSHLLYRLNIIRQFNMGTFDYLIATDDTSLFSGLYHHHHQKALYSLEFWITDGVLMIKQMTKLERSSPRRTESLELLVELTLRA